MAAAKVRVTGLRELRRDLKKLPGQSNRELSKELREAVLPVVVRAKALAPRRTGALVASLKPFALGTRAGVRSRLPYAPVQHWGGTISPLGTPIRIRRTEFITRAIDEMDDRIVDELGDAVERAAKKLGWR